MERVRAFGRFWYDFIVGDDWRIAVGVVAALAITYGVSTSGISAWWVLPVAVVVVLSTSVWTVVRRAR